MPVKPISAELQALRRQNALSLFVRWRLQEIAEGRGGGDKAFAEAVGIDNAHWSRLKAGTPLGPKLARRLEAACGVEAGWLDQSHDGVTQAPCADAARADGTPQWTDVEPLEGPARHVLLQALGPKAALEMPWMLHSTPAGFPSPAADFEVNRVDLAEMLALDEPYCFMTRVRGQSMLNEGIHDGDLVVVNRSLTPKHGDIVVAVVDNELTLKTLYQKDGLTKLVAANPAFPDIVLKDGQTLTVWGVMTACVKLFGRKI